MKVVCIKKVFEMCLKSMCIGHIQYDIGGYSKYMFPFISTSVVVSFVLRTHCESCCVAIIEIDVMFCT